MIKHVGKHNSKKVVILFRTVPNEDHMCLVIYPETLPRHIHDDIMSALESDAGQQAKEFSDYLFRVTLQDGNNALATLHKEGMIKKIPTNQVIVTPNAKSNVRLDELNEIMGKLAKGEEAVKELAELDKNAGMTGKRRPQERTLGEVRTPKDSRSTPAIVDTNIKLDEILTDEQLATQRIAQAQKMAAEAKSLLAESDRLMKEAAALSGSVNETNLNGRPKTKKAAKTKTQEA
jgi:hypothetical protein